MAMTQEQRERLLALRATMDASVANAAEDTAALNAVADFVRPWKPGSYSAGDVRMYENIRTSAYRRTTARKTLTGIRLLFPALWMQYHGTSRETARPWVAPTGAHDQYLVGEWMILYRRRNIRMPQQYRLCAGCVSCRVEEGGIIPPTKNCSFAD